MVIANLFESIVEMALPNFVKYLFWSSTRTKGLFDVKGE